jgi:hypothetical protein
VADSLELALAAGISSQWLGQCVAYVELAAHVFNGSDPSVAVALVAEVAGAPHRGPGLPGLSGEAAPDALAAGMWALLLDEPLAETLAKLAPTATPSVLAAVGGLVGLCQGVDRLPGSWDPALCSTVDCDALASPLLRARFLTSADIEPVDEPPGDHAEAEPAVACAARVAV